MREPMRKSLTGLVSCAPPLPVWLVVAVLCPWAAGCKSTPQSSTPGAVTAGASAQAGTGAAATPATGPAGAAGKVESGSAGVAAVGGAGSSATGSAGRSSAQAGSGAAGTTAAASGSSAGSSGSTAGAAGSAQPDPNLPAAGPFPAVTDFAGDGPFKSTMLSNTGPNSNYTVYLPTELAPKGAKNPIVAWMSGGGTTPSGYTLLPHLATHGFVVVASNTAPGIGAEVMLGQELIMGIDWAIAENERKDSMLFGKLDTTKIASMGYSMGSLATFTIANDPRLTTTVHISGGNMQADRIMNLHAPAAFICGIPGDSSCNILSGDCDIAAANCDTDFMMATTPVFYANFMGGHLGILTEPNMTHIRKLATMWLRWKLMSDSTLTPSFVGDQCTLCKDADWKKVQQKNLQ
jgi:hypothetical protein